MSRKILQPISHFVNMYWDLRSWAQRQDKTTTEIIMTVWLLPLLSTHTHTLWVCGVDHLLLQCVHSFTCEAYVVSISSKQKINLRGLSPLANYTNRVTAVCWWKLVPAFADRGCHVVSVTGPLRPYSRLSRPEPQLSLSSSSSVVLTRLSGSPLISVSNIKVKLR
jgi:hypothetical protein